VQRTIIIGMLCTVIFACMGTSCRTAVPYNGDTVSEFRDVNAEIRDGQAELGITGAWLESEIRGIRTEIGGIRTEIGSIGEAGRNLERSIKDGAGTVQEIRAILQQIRSQPYERKERDGGEDNKIGNSK